jgi:hypothetical protein
VATGTNEQETSSARYMAEFLGGLLLVVLLACVSVLAPLAMAIYVSPSVGVLVAVGSFWVWSRIGPPPMPGFLSGILCLGGHAAILGSMISCAALALR